MCNYILFRARAATWLSCFHPAEVTLFPFFPPWGQSIFNEVYPREGLQKKKLRETCFRWSKLLTKLLFWEVDKPSTCSSSESHRGNLNGWKIRVTVGDCISTGKFQTLCQSMFWLLKPFLIVINDSFSGKKIWKNSSILGVGGNKK